MLTLDVCSPAPDRARGFRSTGGSRCRQTPSTPHPRLPRCRRMRRSSGDALVRRQVGRLTIIQANMNPDLAMGGELLQKTGAATCSRSSASLTSRSAQRAGPMATASWPRSAASMCTIGPPRPSARTLHRRHRLLVPRHRLQRGGVLRSPCVLRWRRPAVREVGEDASCGDR